MRNEFEAMPKRLKIGVSIFAGTLLALWVHGIFFLFIGKVPDMVWRVLFWMFFIEGIIILTGILIGGTHGSDRGLGEDEKGV